MIRPTVESLDTQNAAALKDVVRENLGSGQSMIVDLAGIDFADSAGIGALVSAHRWLKSEGGDLVLSSPTPSLRTLLELVEIHEIIPLFDTVDEAVEASGVGPIGVLR